LAYYLKYPSCVYLSFWDIAKCLEWNVDEESVRQALGHFLKRESIDYGVPVGMPDWVYDVIIQNFNKSKFSAETAGQVITDSGKLPAEFVQFISQQFPSIASAMQDSSIEKRKQFVRDYLSFPSKETFAILDSSQKMNEMDTTNPDNWKLLSPQKRTLSFDIMRYLSNNDDFREKMATVQSGDHFRGDSWTTYGTDMLSELQAVAQAYENDQEFLLEDNPFAIVIDNSPQFGMIKTVLLGSIVVKASVIYEAINAISSSPDNYWGIYWGNELERDLRAMDAENMPDHMEPSIYAINEEEWKYYDLANAGKDFTNPSSVTDSYRDSYIDHLVRASRTTVKEEADLFNEWVEGRMAKGELTDHDYLQMAKSKVVKNLTETAGRDMFSSQIQGGGVLNAEDYRPDTKIHWSDMWPFKMKEAIDFWSKVPMNVRAAVADDVDTWFFHLSGLFPCSKVLERAFSSIGDVKKVVDHMKCAGDSEKLRATVREILATKEKEIEKKVREKLPEFLESDAVKKFKLTDFPEVYHQAVDFMRDNVLDDRVYSHEVGDYISRKDYAQQKLGETNVYFIDASRYLSFLGEDGVNYFPSNPSNSNGFFVSGYSMFGNDPTIVVFTDQINSTPTAADVLRNLGIDAVEKDLSFSEENTLWHEVSHAFLNQVVHGSSDEIESESQWLSSPQEIAAITYGNLQHIKKAIRQYFESIYPFPERITEGFLNQIKSDIIDTFAWEFKGMSKPEAMAKMEVTMPEFNTDAMEVMQSMSQEEQIDSMTNMFTEFFMRKFMRSKVEDELKSKLADIGKKLEDVTFEEEIVVPEEHEEYVPYQSDRFIKELSQRADYQKFFKDCQEIVKNAYNFYDPQTFINQFRSYVDRHNPQQLRMLFGIEDLLLLMFGPPATIDSVNLNNTNSLFESAIPPELLKDVKGIVERERQLRGVKKHIPQPSPISPQEAEEGGQFISEMESEYGPDWMWLAKNINERFVQGSKKNWYRVAVAFHYDANYISNK
jgi:hypothetical protein